MNIVFTIVKYATIIASLIYLGVGLRVAGPLGMLTGFAVPICIGSGIIMALSPGDLDNQQRVAGFVAGILAGLAGFYGGWRWGWAFAIVVYLPGASIGWGIAWLLRMKP